MLLGELGRKFGRRHSFRIRSAAEAVRALRANFPGFERELVRMSEQNVGHRVLVGQEPVQDGSDLHHPSGRQVIKIVPAIAGAGGDFPLGRIFLGAALIAASFFVPAAGMLGLSFLSASAVGLVGLGLALGGIGQLLSPTPGSGSPNEKDANKPSYAFDGPVNTVAQGHPVPLLYGRLIVGSQIISAGVDIDQVGESSGVDPAVALANWDGHLK